MTTLQDYLRDLVIETQKEIIEKNEGKDIKPLSEDEIIDMIYVQLNVIKERLIGSGI